MFEFCKAKKIDNYEKNYIKAQKKKSNVSLSYQTILFIIIHIGLDSLVK